MVRASRDMTPDARQRSARKGVPSFSWLQEKPPPIAARLLMLIQWRAGLRISGVPY